MIAAFDPGTEQLLVETDGRVAKITLNRPEARNALSCPLIRTAHRYLKDNLGEAFSIDHATAIDRPT